VESTKKKTFFFYFHIKGEKVGHSALLELPIDTNMYIEPPSYGIMNLLYW
jgi:hypothetical protein